MPRTAPSAPGCLCVQVYGAVTMNNTLGLGLLYLVCHVNRLQWQYTTETLVTLVASLALGALAVRNRAFRALWGLAALSAYPLVLLAIYILKYRLHIA